MEGLTILHHAARVCRGSRKKSECQRAAKSRRRRGNSQSVTLDEAAVVVAEPATEVATPAADETTATTLVGAALAGTDSATVELLRR